VKLRTASRLAVITLVVAVAGLIYCVRAIQAATHPALQGTSLGSVAAPDFHLMDQFGRPVALDQFHGHPVVLTFLYTHCPDECPLTAEKLRLTLDRLGAAGNGVGVLAVSVDPQRDDQAAAQAFSQQHQLLHRWHYLVGSRDQLAPIWAAYHIAVAPGPTAGTINHTLGLYVIDKQGHERVYLGADFAPATLASDVRVLAGG
jgi:protein SCO1/2